MGFLEPRLSLKVQQKQILTPGLVQMVSLLTLNKLELIDQIQQELVQNPVLEEGTEIVEGHPGNCGARYRAGSRSCEGSRCASGFGSTRRPIESESAEMDDGTRSIPR